MALNKFLFPGDLRQGAVWGEGPYWQGLEAMAHGVERDPEQVPGVRRPPSTAAAWWR